MVFDAVQLISHEFKSEYFLRGGVFYNAFGSLVVALGHVGLIMLIVQSGAITWLTRRLAAVGRMALSNYLTHSIVCTTLFYGYGFGDAFRMVDHFDERHRTPWGTEQEFVYCWCIRDKVC